MGGNIITLQIILIKFFAFPKHLGISFVTLVIVIIVVQHSLLFSSPTCPTTTCSILVLLWDVAVG